MPSDAHTSLSNMFDERTILARAREAAGLSQVEASRLLRLSRGTWNVYETGRVKPSERRVWELLSELARGERVAGRPGLLVSFALVGQRFVSWRRGLVVLTDLSDAARLVGELEACGLERVLVLPVWPSALNEVVEADRQRGGEGRAVVFPDGKTALDVLLQEAFHDLAEASASWCSEYLRPSGDGLSPSHAQVA